MDLHRSVLYKFNGKSTGGIEYEQLRLLCVMCDELGQENLL